MGATPLTAGSISLAAGSAVAQRAAAMIRGHVLAWT
jgi:hypothetical protein